MKICYIILAHKNPEQLKRLINRLIEPWTTFFVHIDKNVPIESFKAPFRQNNQVFFLDSSDRESGIWGDVGIVRATLNAMERSFEKYKPDTFILLSGQDYPLRNNLSIYGHFKENPEVNFIDLNPMPIERWENGGLKRVNRYKINKSPKRAHFTLIPSIFDKDFYTWQTAGKLNYLRKSGKINDLLKIFKKRKFPDYLKPYGGSVYFALPAKTVEDILKFVENHPDYLTYHHYTLSADEIFFHSIVGHLEKQKNLIIRPSLTYVNWNKTEGSLPATFEADDFKELNDASKEHFLARKFDFEIDTEILDRIDQELL